MNRAYTFGLLALVALVALMLTALVAGSAQAGSEIRQEVELELMPSKAMPGATGEAELELRIDDEGAIDFQARARAEGLMEGGKFALYVDGVLVDKDEAEGGGVDFDEDPEVTFTTLSGLLVTITDSTGEVVLHAHIP